MAGMGDGGVTRDEFVQRLSNTIEATCLEAGERVRDSAATTGVEAARLLGEAAGIRFACAKVLEVIGQEVTSA